MKYKVCLMFVALVATALPGRAELLEVDLSIYGMD